MDQPKETRAGVGKKNNADQPTSAPKSLAPQRMSSQGLIIWLTAVMLYMMAVTGRTSFGVASVQAIEQYQINATQLAVFAALQLGTYALAQIPVGLMVDRYGARKLLIAGALVMGIGQVILAFGSSYPVALGARMLVGAGDATAFASLMRLIPAWVPLRIAPMISQLSGALGQFGQFLSAVPFLALLHASSWTTAFLSLGAMGLLLALIAAVLIKDSPNEPSRAEKKAQRERAKTAPAASAAPAMSAWETFQSVLRNRTCWHGFFVHWAGLGTLVAFTMLWGVPILTMGMGQSSGYAGLALTLSTVATVLAGPVVGVLSARMGHKRWVATLTGSSIAMAGWLWFFFSSDARSAFFGLAITILMGAMAPVSNLAFDSVREQVDRSMLATGTGLANMGGWTAGMIVAQIMGLVLTWAAPAEDYAWGDFRLAWIVAVVVWACGAVGIVLTRPRKPARSVHRAAALQTASGGAQT